MTQQELLPDPIVAEHRRKEAERAFRLAAQGKPHDAELASKTRGEAVEEIIVSNRVAPQLRDQARHHLLALDISDLSRHLDRTRKNDLLYKAKAMGRIDQFSSAD